MFNNCSTIPLVADINGGNNNNCDGMNGGWWAWWIIILCMFGWGGFGGYGWGGGAGGQQFTQADMQRGFDTQNLLNGQRSLENGLCSLGYDQLGQFNALGMAMQQGNFGLQQSITQAQIAQMQANNTLSAQFAQCCCDDQLAAAQNRYDMATMGCNITNAIKDATNANMQNCNANYRSLENKIDNLVIASKDQKIADLTAQLNRCDRDTALQGTASYIISNLNPTPKPGYIVPNPNAPYYGGCYGYGYGYGNNRNSCCDNNCNPCCA